MKIALRTSKKELLPFVETRSQADAVCNTDEWKGYNGLNRTHPTVNHGAKEYARDDDGDGIREVHTNTMEGIWTGFRNFIRPFRGVNKAYLGFYAAVFQWINNTKAISSAFILAMVAL